jgi:hypothetical protein
MGALERARALLTPTDLKVAEIGYRFMEDQYDGYGPFYDGTEQTIALAQAWLQGQVAGIQPLPQVLTEHKDVPVPGDTWIEEKYRVIPAPQGLLKQDVHSPDFMAGQTWPKGWTYDQVEALGVKTEDIPLDEWYTGLNLDEDCAVAELLEAVASAYSLFADGFEWEELPLTYREQFWALGLSPASARVRFDELLRLSSVELRGKHDRNEQVWC